MPQHELRRCGSQEVGILITWYYIKHSAVDAGARYNVFWTAFVVNEIQCVERRLAVVCVTTARICAIL